MRPLECLLESSSPIAEMRISGQLDLATVVGVRTALHKALTGQPAAIVVDVAGLTTADDVMLTVFAAFARTAAAWPGCPVLLCCPDAALRAGFDQTGISRVLPIYPDRAAAVAAAERLPPPLHYRRALPSNPSAPTIARQVVAEACQAWQLAALADDAEMVVTELVTNAVRYAPGDIQLSITLREHFLHVAVHDHCPDPPRRRLPDPDNDEGGRGLLLVDAIAAGWGSTPSVHGKRVWATLRRP
ncbi:MAG: hypothetical protein QOI74_2919 [Micromonosporaceae bacterium]|nr:hypothetical protein [Micromonosporaceae bacterium]